MYLPSDPKTWDVIFHDQLVRKIKFWLPVLGIGIVTFALSESDIKRFLLIEKFVDAVSYFVPSIKEWSERSFRPHTTSLLFTLYWLVLPYYVFIFLNYKPYECHFVETWLRAGPKRHLYPFLLVSMGTGFFALFYFFVLPEEQNCTLLCIHESLGIQFVYGGVSVVGVASIVSSLVWWLRNFRKIHLTRFNKGVNNERYEV